MRVFLRLFAISLISVSCSYDYAALGGQRDGGGQGSLDAVGSGGTSPVATGGSGGGGLATGGRGGGEPATGGSGGGGLATGGSGGTVATGGAGGAGAAVAGGGRGGGDGTGGGGGTMMRVLSIDFVGAYAPPVATGGAAGGTAGAGGGANGGRGGVGGASVVVGGASGAGVPVPLVPLPVMAPTEIAGVKRAARWNGALGMTGGLSNLVLSDGTTTAAAVTWNSPPSATLRGMWWNSYVDAPGDVRMMNGYLDPHSALMPELPASVTVTGLPTSITGGGYDVYVYVTGEVPTATRTYRYILGTATFTVTQVGPSPTVFSGYVLAPPGGAGNYIVFQNLTGPSFTLNAIPGSGARAPLNGIQIVSPSGS